MAMQRYGPVRRAIAVLMVPLFLGAATAVCAQTLDSLELRQDQSAAEYQRLSQQIALSRQRQEDLAAEIASMKDDNAALTAALIQAVKTERKLGEDIDEILDRLERLDREENQLKQSLKGRRGTLAEVLGALQRMGLNPPPAILVRPEDALGSVRSAILLGAVVPELRSETEMLARDLEDLSRVVASISIERKRLEAKRTEQAEEKQRLTLLLAEKRRMQADAEERMERERQEAEALAERAGSLQELISSLESEIESLREALQRSTIEGEGENRLAEALPFARREGLLPLPVSGRFSKRFGDDDGTGAPLNGDILRTQSGAIVTSPASGTVVYAGPFRSYGQLLILNPGDGYHVVMAGMDRLNVALGQEVLAGEPVGMMGEARLASIATLSLGNTTPELYVEFRRNGKPIDPQRWWAQELSGRTGNDT